MADTDIYDRIMIHEVAEREVRFDALVARNRGFWADFRRFTKLAAQQQKLADDLWSQIDGVIGVSPHVPQTTPAENSNQPPHPA